MEIGLEKKKWDAKNLISVIRWEVNLIGQELKKLRAEPMPVVKLSSKLQSLDRVKALEQRRKGMQDYLDSVQKACLLGGERLR